MRMTIGRHAYFMPNRGGYVFLELEGRPGTLGLQLCEGGNLGGGHAVSANPATFDRVCRRWHRARLALIRSGDVSAER